MTEKQKKEAKKRILDEATLLFAKKGYAGVGVREIAKKADVNISMISYYFDGKVGILKEIINEFHNRYYQIISDNIDDDKTPEECAKMIISGLINFIRANTELVMTAFHSIPLDIPEIAELKMERVSGLFKKVSGLFNRIDLDMNDAVLMSTVGPALISIILMHFRLRPVQKKIFNLEFDDAFYDRYTEVVTSLFLYGVTGFTSGKHQTQGDKK